MKTTLRWALAAVCLTQIFTQTGIAAELLSPSDFIIAIDTDPGTPDTNYPGGEGPINVLDNLSGTKYFNFGKFNTGFIATPFTAGTIVQSLQLTAANDAPERDPLTYKLWGTNDTITSADNSFGDQENWSLISQGTSGLDTDPGRFLPGSVQSFANATPYDSYKFVFPTLRDGNIADGMQVADVGLFTSADGSGTSVFNIGNPVVAIGLNEKPDAASPPDQGPTLLIDDFGGPQSSYPGAESPANVVDGTLAKYLNFGGSNSGFIVTPASGSAQVQSFRLTTANDFEERDPATWELFGTNDPIISADNSFGTDESWTSLDFGALSLPSTRDALGPVIPVTNANSYSSYKLLFPQLKVLGNQAMQFAEASFFESTNGSGPNLLSPVDLVLAIDGDQLPGTETTHVNFGEENGGFIVTPAIGTTTVDQFHITTGGDETPRDPASWELYGTNDPITSEPFSQGNLENWVLIDSGAFDMATEIPLARNTTGAPVSVINSTAYSSYRMIFPTVRDADNAESIQMAEVQFFGVIPDNADFDGDDDVDGADFLTWQRGLGLTDQTNNGNGDANRDGDVNAADLAIWKIQYATTPMVSASTAVPEPSTAMLVMFGVIVASTGIGCRDARGGLWRRRNRETRIECERWRGCV